MAKIADVVEGLTILSRYTEKGTESHVAGADHDVLYGPFVKPDKLSPEDRDRLAAIRWKWDDGAGAWSRFV